MGFFLLCWFFSRKQIFPISLEMPSMWSVPTVSLRYRTCSKDCTLWTEASTVSSWKSGQTQRRKVSLGLMLLRVSLSQYIASDRWKYVTPIPGSQSTTCMVTAQVPQVGWCHGDTGTCCSCGFFAPLQTHQPQDSGVSGFVLTGHTGSEVNVSGLGGAGWVVGLTC